MTTIVAFDLETTGRLRTASDHWLGQPGIVQFGAIKISDDSGEWLEVARCDIKLNPELPDDAWDPGAIEVTGIGPEQVRDAPTLLTAHAEIAEFFRGASYSLGYNILYFDYPVLEHQLRRYSLQRHFPWPPKTLDLMTIGTHKVGAAGQRGEKRWKLSELYQHVTGRELAGAHDAINDVAACVELFKAWGGLPEIIC